MKFIGLLGLTALLAVAGCGKPQTEGKPQTWQSATPPPSKTSDRYGSVQKVSLNAPTRQVAQLEDVKEEDGVMWIRSYDKKWWVPVQHMDGERRRLPEKQRVK